jgi:hypothetical protein
MWNILKSAFAPKSLKGSEVYDHVLGRRFDPGAQAEVFVPGFGLPVMLFRGNARLAGSRNVFQPPQVWFRPVQRAQGLGGVQAGQIIWQQPFDPSQIGEGGGGE